MKQAYTEKAYAKINTYLDITGKTDDGYHTLLTVMRKIDLCDEITMTAEGNFYDAQTVFVSIITDSDDVPFDRRNVIYKMTERFFEVRGKAVSLEKRRGRVAGDARLAFDVEKRIPVGGGLGGSSADGAAALRLLQTAFGAETAEETAELTRIAGEISADAPFLFIPEVAAVCRGKGDVITPVSPAETGNASKLYLAIVQPGFAQDTAAAYAAYDAAYAAIERMTEVEEARLIGGSSNRDAAETIFNVFEHCVNKDIIAEVKRELRGKGAYAAGLTGSGSCVFGVFDSFDKAKAAAAELKYPFSVAAQTL